MGEYGDYFGFSVSHTTRQPRPGEQDGKDYHYVTRYPRPGEQGGNDYQDTRYQRPRPKFRTSFNA